MRLKTFLRLKVVFGDVAYGRNALADRAERKLSGEGRTRSVVVVGEIKRGKSMLVNALIGRDGITVDDVENATAVSIRFVPADAENPEGTAELVFPDGNRRIPHAELADWTTTGGRYVTDPAVEALPLLQQQVQVGAQGGRGVALTVEDLGDRGERQAELAQQQDSLQPHEGVLVVVAVAVRADPGGRQQADVVVVPQRPAGGAGRPRDLLDRPHAVLLSRRVRR